MHIKKNDTVAVITGKDKGKKGKILKAFPKEGRVVVEGVNIKKRHQRARRGGQKGQIVEYPAPMHVSNVMLVDSKSGKPSRVRMKTDGNKKVRVSAKSGNAI
ncbi:MAG: 50S ribosomal protein L24 [Candidatus Lloydbacteria bacterium]|nr:50S ribosomal protein L24 [Candidatus Lloydbacteria bacterium]